VITVARRFGDKVRVAAHARGERTGASVQGRAGVVCDTLPADEQSGERERYWVRFDRHGFEIFYDWIRAADLRDY
jgi:hypothetical protein